MNVQALKEYIALASFAIGAGLFQLFWVRNGDLLIKGCGPRDVYARTKAILILLTAAYFSLHHHVYSLAIVGIWFWMVRRRSPEEQLGYFFLLSMIVPNVYAWQLPFPGINKILDLDSYRIFTILILLPLAIRFQRNPKSAFLQNPIDKYILVYFLLILVPKIGFLSFTNWQRYWLLIFIDQFLPYFVLSRMASNPSTIRQIVLSVSLIGIYFGLMAAVEALKGWHFYDALSSSLKVPFNWSGYGPQRSGYLRAYGSFFIPIAFGIFFMLNISMYLALSTVASYRFKKAIFASGLIVFFGMVMTFSRTPLTGLALFIFVFFLIRYWIELPRLITYTIFAIPLLCLAIAAFASTKVGYDYLMTIPGIGNEGEESFTYRESLYYAVNNYLETAPIFGDPDYLSAEELQLQSGDLSIDLTNTYLEIAVVHGKVVTVFFVLVLIRLGGGLLPFLTVWRTLPMALFYQFMFAMLVSYAAMIYAVSQVAYLPYITAMLMGAAASASNVRSGKSFHQV